MQPEIWRHDLTRLRRAGFEAVDLVDTWLSPGDMSHAALDRLRDALERAELKLVGVSVIRRSIIDPQDGDANMVHTLASIEAAHRLGAPVVSIGFHRPLTAAQQGDWPFWAVRGPVDASDATTRRLAVDRLRELCRRAKGLGVALSLELYEDTLIGWGKDTAELVSEVGEDNLGINPDLANIWRQPRALRESWRETLAWCLPYMNYWHVKNFCRAPAWPAGPYVTFPTAMADGDIDYWEAFNMAASSGYTGPICIEHYGGDRLWAQRSALHYVNWLLGEMED
ncbi:MAG: sugar phosphate isomerase/epimerase [Acidimicrobiaceae bacterium]|nr:sugar phosphate isomerase/epimerase [Acidimicrobiaceae bacterium]